LGRIGWDHHSLAEHTFKSARKMETIRRTRRAKRAAQSSTAIGTITTNQSSMDTSTPDTASASDTKSNSTTSSVEETARPADEYTTEQLLPDPDEKACVICTEREANIQCVPCKHIVCCYQCLIRLACETYVNNGDKEQCPLCRTEIQVFKRLDTRQLFTPGDIQDEHTADTQYERVAKKFREAQENKSAAVEVERTEIAQVYGDEDQEAQRELTRRSLRIRNTSHSSGSRNNNSNNNNNNNNNNNSNNALPRLRRRHQVHNDAMDIDLEENSEDDERSDSSEYAEDDYSEGEITAEDMRIAKEMYEFERRGREEYLPSDNDEPDADGDEALAYHNNHNHNDIPAAVSSVVTRNKYHRLLEEGEVASDNSRDEEEEVDEDAVTEVLEHDNDSQQSSPPCPYALRARS
jgi:hypothetical protein